MEITIPIKLAIASEIMEEMIRFGHTSAATHVDGYRKRQVAKLSEAAMIIIDDVGDVPEQVWIDKSPERLR